MSPRLCPICKRDIPPADFGAPYRPFCSARCKTVDLGAWLSADYRIARPLSEEELDAGLPEGLDPDAGEKNGN